MPVRISFAQQVDGLAAATRPALEPMVAADGKVAKVRLDSEMADMARNAVHYQALARGLNKHLGVMALAAGDGKK